MSVFASPDPTDLVGLEPDMLSYDQRLALSGKWIASKIYSPKTTPVRKIDAVGESAADCARQLVTLGEDPANYEFQWVSPTG